METHEQTKKRSGKVTAKITGRRQKTGISTIRTMGIIANEQTANIATTGMNKSANGIINGLPVRGRCNHHGSDMTTTMGARARSGVMAGRSNNMAAQIGMANTATTARLANCNGPWTGEPSSLRTIHH